MADIRLVRPRNTHVWLWTGLLAVVALGVWLGSTLVFGDATAKTAGKKVGQHARFGADRAQVMPLRTEPFEAAIPLEDRELGRLLRFTGTAESGVRRNALVVRSRGGQRILVRFEPAPPAGALGRIYPGSTVRLDGYLQKIARAEYLAWMDSLGVVVPRPQPGVKFGDLPDPSFARVDSLFIKSYYLSVRPEGIGAHTPGVSDTAVTEGGIPVAPGALPPESAARTAPAMAAPTAPARREPVVLPPDSASPAPSTAP
jgi:hypothetical protein